MTASPSIFPAVTNQFCWLFLIGDLLSGDRQLIGFLDLYNYFILKYLYINKANLDPIYQLSTIINNFENNIILFLTQNEIF